MPKQSHDHLNSPERADMPAELVVALVDHRDENWDRIMDEVEAEKPDIIALELVGSSLDEREETQAKINRHLAGRTTTGDEMGDYSVGDVAVISRFARSGVRFTYIDTDADHPLYDALERETGFTRAYRRQDGNTHYDRLVRRRETEKYIESAAVNDAERESIVARQLEALIAKNAGKKIVAIVGAAHTGLLRELSDDIETDYFFVPSKEAEAHFADNEIIRFSPVEAAIRAQRLGRKTIAEIVDSVLDTDGFIRHS